MSDFPIRMTAVVCTYNRAALLPACLGSLLNQNLPDREYEIVVVDNCSTDNTRRVVRRLATKNLRYVREPEQGLSHARNRGYHEARGEYVAYIDDDARASRDWLEVLLRGFGALDSVPVSVGGPILPWYRDRKPSWFLEDWELRTWGDRAQNFTPPYPRRGFSGSNMAWPRELLGRLKGFSVSLGMKADGVALGEETELYARAAQQLGQGAVLRYEPQALVYHLVPKEKMTIRYQWKRRYAEGKSAVRIASSGSASTKPFIGLALCGLCFGVLKQLMRAIEDLGRWKSRCEKTICERGGYVAYYLGGLVQAWGYKRDG